MLSASALPSIWSASEGATAELKNFPNMLYGWNRRARQRNYYIK
jgi:hypothetical protein